MISIKYNFEKDLDNWCTAVHKKSHGVDWSFYIPEKVKSEIKNLDDKQIKEILDK
jgi:hypothetical protein